MKKNWLVFLILAGSVLSVHAMKEDTDSDVGKQSTRGFEDEDIFNISDKEGRVIPIDTFVSDYVKGKKEYDEEAIKKFKKQLKYLSVEAYNEKILENIKITKGKTKKKDKIDLGQALMLVVEELKEQNRNMELSSEEAKKQHAESMQSQQESYELAKEALEWDVTKYKRGLLTSIFTLIVTNGIQFIFNIGQAAASCPTASPFPTNSTLFG